MDNNLMRVLFYCHSIYGLGHVITSLRIAEAVLETGKFACSIITGCPYLDAIAIDPRIQIFNLPPVFKHSTDYDVIVRRTNQILEVCRYWKPNVVVVDQSPLGLCGEMVQTLLTAKEEEWTTHFIWGIHYPDESHHKIVNQSKNPRTRAALERYDSVIAYSEVNWIEPFSMLGEYIRHKKTFYTGIVTSPPLPHQTVKIPLIVGLGGGGTGGRKLLEIILAAMNKLMSSSDIKLRFVTGPMGHQEEIAQLVSNYSNIEIWDKGSAEAAVQDANVVLSRCGYSAAYSLVRTDLPLIFIPSTIHSIEEQMERGHYLAQLPNVWMVDERQPDAIDTLTNCLRAALKAPRQERQLPFRVNGAANAAAWILKVAQREFSLSV